MVPSAVAAFLLRHNLGLKLSMGSTDPERVVEDYLQEVSRFGRDIQNTVLLEVGYGGGFGTAVSFLQRGARHVYLFDPLARPSVSANRGVARSGTRYLCVRDGAVIPHPQWITVLPEEFAAPHFRHGKPDFIFSNAVLEHVRDIHELFDRLCRSAPGAFHAHHVDLRDHYYRYPFEMLCYSDGIWNRFLDPEYHLNRLRLHDYMTLLNRHFSHSGFRITEGDTKNFQRLKHRIKPRFLSGNDTMDAALKAWVFAW